VSLKLLHDHKGMMLNPNEQHSVVDEADRVEALRLIADLERQLTEARAIEVDSGKCILAQLWKDTGGIIPSTGKAWVTGKQLNRTIFGEKLKGGKQ
jgi:hypothetical protein